MIEDFSRNSENECGKRDRECASEGDAYPVRVGRYREWAWWRPRQVILVARISAPAAAAMLNWVAWPGPTMEKMVRGGANSVSVARGVARSAPASA